MATKPLSLPDDISRLLFLSDALRIPIPAQISKSVFMGDLMTLVSTKGYKAAITDLGIPADQLDQAMKRGAEDGPADESEFRMLIAAQALEGIDGSIEELGVSKYLGLVGMINDFSKASKSDMIAFRRESMHNIEADEDFPKWNTNLAPIDMLTEGVYQGIHLLLAKSGSGKTSTMLTLVECLARAGFQSLWYVSTEIPMKMMKYRMSPIIARTALPKGFEIMTGQITPKQLLHMHEEEFDESRVIVHDSPDALGSGAGDQRRFTLEDHYRDLVALKEKCAAVFTVSQVRRKDRVLGMDSVAESWAKAWYSDIIWTIGRTGFLPNGLARMHASVVKNRFGVVDRKISYLYNYATLEYELPAGTQVTFLDDDWEGNSEDVDPTIEATRENTPRRGARQSRAEAGGTSGASW